MGLRPPSWILYTCFSLLSSDLLLYFFSQVVCSSCYENLHFYVLGRYLHKKATEIPFMAKVSMNLPYLYPRVSNKKSSILSDRFFLCTSLHRAFLYHCHHPSRLSLSLISTREILLPCLYSLVTFPTRESQYEISMNE